MDPKREEQGNLGGEGAKQVNKSKGQLTENEDDKEPVTPGNIEADEGR